MIKFSGLVGKLLLSGYLVACLSPSVVSQSSGVKFSHLVGGGFHTCVLGSDNRAYCWGRNNYGQLGNGDTAPSEKPTMVKLPTGIGFSQLGAGTYHTCALGSDKKVYCWGSNGNSQLGDGSGTEFSTTPTLVKLPSAISFSQLVVGYDHSCALGSDSKAYCWGWNKYGQLGNGTTTQSKLATAVKSPNGVNIIGVMPGYDHTCAIGSDKKAYCWGRNEYGQLGNGSSTQSIISTPLAVKLPSGLSFSQLVAGGYYTCALGSDKNAYCWGGNSDGQLGNGTDANRNIPTAVKLPSGVHFNGLELGDRHTCALGSDSKTYCWGYNNDGQLGNGSETSRKTPTIVKLPSGVSFSQLGAGYDHTCALGSNSKAYCWGGNLWGKLGNGSLDDSTTPVVVSQP